MTPRDREQRLHDLTGAEEHMAIRWLCDQMPEVFDRLAKSWGCKDRKGGDPAEWPEPFPRQYPVRPVAKAVTHD